MGEWFMFIIFLLTIIAQVFSVNEVLRGQSVLYGISSLSQSYDNSSVCFRHLSELFDAAESQKVWAIKALDASGGPVPGFLYGNNLWVGSHSQCADISNRKLFEVNHRKIITAKSTPHDYPPFPMNFAMAYMTHNNTLQQHIQIPLEMTIQLGLCVPKSCSESELLQIISDFMNNKYLPFQNIYDIHLNTTEVKLLVEDGAFIWKLPKTNLLMFIIITTILLSIIGTTYDVKQHNRSKNLITGHNNATIAGKANISSMSEIELVSQLSLNNSEKPSLTGEILKCFSLYSNIRNLVKVQLPQDSIPCIHGLRFFGMVWVIVVHAIFFAGDFLQNPVYVFRLSEPFLAQIFSNSTYCVDTYFFLSGFLLAYLFFKPKPQDDDEGTAEPKSNPAKEAYIFTMMFANRLLRLTPPYAVLILLTNVLAAYFRRTSALLSSEQADVHCSTYWWRNILYINNLFPRSEMCLSWSWYLSIDTQFFLIGTFLLILSKTYFKCSAVLLCSLIGVNVAATAYKSYAIQYIPTMDEQLAQLDAIYDLPWNRIGPYLIGILTAYVLLRRLKRQLTLGKTARLLLWTLFPMLNLWILFTLYTRQVSVEFSAFYMGVSRTLWGVGIGWLLVACCTGHANRIDAFLSFPGWIPLSRLCYCAYLLNPLIATIIYLGNEAPYNASIAGGFLTVSGVILLTFGASFVFSMLFESPFILLTKLLFSKRKKPHPDNNQHQAA